MKKEYITLPLKDIVPYGNNPRINDNAIPYVEDSIQQVGYIAPIIIDEDNVILAGHTRLKALQNQNGGGSASVEVLRVSGLSEEAKKKYRYYDNKAGEFAAYDFEKLEQELAGFDLGAFEIDFGEEEARTAYGQNQSGGYPGFQPPQPPPADGHSGDDRRDELKGNVPDMGDMEPDPYDDDLINQYSQNSEDYVARRRVILTYRPEQEEDVRSMLGITEDKMKILYDLDELLGNDRG